MNNYNKKDYIKGVLECNRRMLAKTITLIESNNIEDEKLGMEILEELISYDSYNKNTIRLGVSGSPGVGKSTFIENLGLNIIKQGKKLVVLAIDPSSQISKGSILGDKTRMEELSASNMSFIRPSPSAGTLGGVAKKTRETMIVCEAAGFDVIIVETVGVGQSEIIVNSITDFFLLMMLPNAGDELQGIKRGIMEYADAIVINKADGENRKEAELTKTYYQNALHILKNKDYGWDVPVLTCSALNNEGIDKLWEILQEHHKMMVDKGYFEEKRKNQNKDWLWNLIQDKIKNILIKSNNLNKLVKKVEKDVLLGITTPTKASTIILEEFIKNLSKNKNLLD